MSTLKRKFALITRLQALGFTFEESQQLRRTSMTLSKWAEMECGDESGRAIERGEETDLQLINWPDQNSNVWLVEKRAGGFTPIREIPTKDRSDPQALRALRREKALNIPGKPYVTFDSGNNGRRSRYPIADREAGALKRLKAIVDARNARHFAPNTEANRISEMPEFVFAYQQGDPRGCALYLLKRADLREGETIDSIYSRGLAVCA